jgi:hypothetical protein
VLDEARTSAGLRFGMMPEPGVVTSLSGVSHEFQSLSLIGRDLPQAPGGARSAAAPAFATISA